MPKLGKHENPGVVYALIDPTTKKVRYVGHTTRTVEARLADHLSKSSLIEFCPKNEWLRELLNQGLKPGMVILEECSGWKLVDAEQRWIEIFRSETQLTNRFPSKDPRNEFVKAKVRIQRTPKAIVSENRLLQLEREKDATRACLASKR